MSGNSLSTETKRNPVIDIAKGMGIIFVVTGHTYSPLRSFVYLFHVPLFIFLSGLVNKKQQPFLVFLKKRIVGLYLPFVVAGVSFLVAHNLLVKIGAIENPYNLKEAGKQVLRILLFSLGEKEELLVQLWFLKDLFIIEMVFFGLRKISGANRALLAGLVLTFTGLGWYASKLVWTYPILRVNFMAPAILLPFYALATHVNLQRLEKSYVPFLVVPGCLILYLVSMYDTVDLIAMKLMPPAVFYSVATVGILTTISAAQNIRRINWLQDRFTEIGRHTLGILCMHFAAFKIPLAMAIFVFSLKEENLLGRFGIRAPYGWLFCVAFGVYFPILLIRLKNQIRARHFNSMN